MYDLKQRHATRRIAAAAVLMTVAQCGLLTPAPDGDDNGPDEAGAPTVELLVSNPVPQLDETVMLTCRIVAGDPANARFSFQSLLDRLVVDAIRGTASFVVSEPDLFVEFSFTCSATNDHGTSAPSNVVVVIPIG